jgi:crotonobetainyl-CoA:carnitine CoA-transferase CaiB-like acyl-CoA transferase
LGLDYDDVRASNPRLIYCSISGFGRQGPYSTRPGYDLLVQAVGGLMSLTGAPDGGPQKTGVAVTDLLTGLYAANGVLAALAHRDRTGVGQRVDVALLDVQVACLANQAEYYFVSGAPPPRLGNAHPTIVPYQSFVAADGEIVIAVGNDAQFARFSLALEHGEWAHDKRFATNAARVANRPTLINLIAREVIAWRLSDLLQRLEMAEVPAGPINDLRAVFDDPHVGARGIRVDMPDRQFGSVPVVANPLRMSMSAIEYRTAPPRCGEDTRTVLQEHLGYCEQAIDELIESGVAAVPHHSDQEKCHAAEDSPPGCRAENRRGYEPGH